MKHSNCMIVIGLLLLTGCGGPEFAAVDGTVTIDGKPLADAEVQFIPDPELGSNGPPTSAYTDAAGRYVIEKVSGGGVIVGKHRVCINDATIMMPGGGDAVDPTDGTPTGPDGQASSARRRLRFPVLYSDVTKTPLAPVEIAPGHQTHNFELRARP